MAGFNHTIVDARWQGYWEREQTFATPTDRTRPKYYAIAEMMVFVNEATKATAVPRAWFEAFVRILSPFAPHLAEELWQRLGHTTTIAYELWPAYDDAKLARDVMTLAVQVNGKVRGQIEVPPDASEQTILTAAKADHKVQPFLAGKEIKKAIYVKGRLVSLVL